MEGKNEIKHKEGKNEVEDSYEMKFPKHKKNSIALKIKIVNIIKGGNSLHSIEDKYGIDLQCLRDWVLNEEKLLLAQNKNEAYRLPGG